MAFLILRLDGLDLLGMWISLVIGKKCSDVSHGPYPWDRFESVFGVFYKQTIKNP